MVINDNKDSITFEFDKKEMDYMARQFGADDNSQLTRTHINDVLDFIYRLCQRQGKENLFDRFPQSFSVSCHISEDKLSIKVSEPPVLNPVQQEDVFSVSYGIAYLFPDLRTALDCVSISQPAFCALYKQSGRYYLYSDEPVAAFIEYSLDDQDGVYLPDDVICYFEDGKPVSYNDIKDKLIKEQ